MIFRRSSSTLYLYSLLYFFFFNDTATTEIYTLSLHDALPIYFFNNANKVNLGADGTAKVPPLRYNNFGWTFGGPVWIPKLYKGKNKLLYRSGGRSEEHTSELQSHSDLVCRLLLEKKKSISTQASHMFTTADDNQPSVQIQFFQGEREIAAYNKKIAMIEVNWIALATRGMPQIEVI